MLSVGFIPTEILHPLIVDGSSERIVSAIVLTDRTIALPIRSVDPVDPWREMPVPQLSKGVNQKTLHRAGKVKYKGYVDSFHIG